MNSNVEGKKGGREKETKGKKEGGREGEEEKRRRKEAKTELSCTCAFRFMPQSFMAKKCSYMDLGL